MTMPEKTDRNLYILICVAIILALVWLILGGNGCARREIRNDPPVAVTVTPHPELGWKIVTVPPGTWVDGVQTTEPGFYLTWDVVASMLTRIQELEAELRKFKVAKGE